MQIQEPSFSDSLQDFILAHAARVGGPQLPRNYDAIVLQTTVEAAKQHLDSKVGPGTADKVIEAWKKGPTWAVGVVFPTVLEY